MAYILGFITADGCIIKGTYEGYSGALKFGVQAKDGDILEKIKSELAAAHAISINKNAAHLCLTSQKIVNGLKKLGIRYRKSLRENVPPMPQSFIRDFIMGVFDGDGGISISEKSRRRYPSVSVCGSKAIVTFIRDHLLRVQSVYSTVTMTPSHERNLFLCSITYRCTSAQKILRYLYNGAPLYLERKYERAREALSIAIQEKEDNYSPGEIETIRQFYPMYQQRELLKLLPQRTWPGIRRQAWKLGAYKYEAVSTRHRLSIT